jgi:hypothetical protein
MFGMLFLFAFFSFLLPVLYSINDFHIIPCLWKKYPDGTAAVMSLELSYSLQQESSCDLYFIIDGKRFALNSTLGNELKKKTILKVMAINDNYYSCFIFASYALIPYVFSPFLFINPLVVGQLLIKTTAAVDLTVCFAICHWFYGFPLALLCFAGPNYNWTESKLENKIRSLEGDEEAPMVRV